MKDKKEDLGELVREVEVMLPNGNGVKTKVYRGKTYRPKKKEKR